MSNNGDNKPVNSFALLSQKMNEVQKSKKPNKNKNSSGNLSRSDSSSSIFIDEKDKMSPPRKDEFQSGDQDPDVPDRSFGDYYCTICDSHMNSDGMWEAHITGKRHTKNVDKGNKDPKYDHLDVESCIKQEIKNVKDPVIGLSYIHEIRRKDKGAPPIFTCFLCQATFPTVPLTIEHVLTMKHRMNFMKENSPDDYQLLEATNLKKGHMEPLVEEMTLKLEEKFGRGVVKVKQERPKVPPYTYSSKRSLLIDDEEEKYPRKNKKSDDKDTYPWKKEQHAKKEIVTKDKYKDVDNRRNNDSDEDIYKRRSPVRSRLSKLSPPRSRLSRLSPARDSFNKLDSYNNRRYESSFSHDSYKNDSFYNKRTSPIRSFHLSSSSPCEPVKENYKIPYGPEPPPFLSSSSRQFEEKVPPQNHPLTSEDDDLLPFLKKFYALSPNVFFNLVCLKLQSLDVKSVDELSLFAKIINKAQTILCKKLPPDVQAVIMNRLSQSENVSSNSPQVNPQIDNSSFRQSHQGDLSFVNEFLDHQRSQTVRSSVPPATAQSAGNGVPPLRTPSFTTHTYGSSSQTYGNSSQTYGSSSQTYGNPSQTYRIPVTSTTTQGNISSSQTYRIPVTSTTTQGNISSSQTYGSSGQTYRNPIVGSTPQGNVNSYQSSEKYASSFQNNSRDYATLSNSTGIPGLTLAEGNRERENYSYETPPNQSSHYPSYGF